MTGQNQYYSDNIFKRSWRAVVDTFKKIPAMKFDAVAGAIGFFIVLVALLEYKVFESMYGMTRDILLTASALAVTAFGGVYAEVVLSRNENATDDQRMIADWIFGISLVTSAFVGFGAWAQSSGFDVVNLGYRTFTVPEYSKTVFGLITVVTLADILLLRAYFRGDVKAKHRRNVARSISKKTQAELTMEDKLIDFDVEVKSKTEQILRLEARRKVVRDELTTLYGGRVPEDVMKTAMRELDNIMTEIKTGEDLNHDGVVGLPSLTFAQTTPVVKMDDRPKNPHGGPSDQ